MLPTKKILDKNNPENTVVHLVLRDDNNEEYDCVGVLVREEEQEIRVAFSAKNDKVVDFLDIKRPEIVSINIVSPESIKKI